MDFNINFAHSRLSVSQMLNVLIMCFMFLASANFINLYYYWVFIAFFITLLAPNRRIIVNISLLFLVVFSISIIIFNPTSHKKLTYLLKPLVYPMCYLMGISLFKYNSQSDVDINQKEKNVNSVIYILTAGTMLHFLLNMSININATSRRVLDYWTSDVMSATGQAVLASMMIGLIAAFLFSNVSLKKKLVALAALILIILYNLILAGRTIFALIIILMIFAYLHRSIITKKKYFITLLITALLFVVFLSIYNFDLFGLKTKLENSNFYYRFFNNEISTDISQDSRLDHKKAYIKYFFDYPFGGSNIKKIYGHHAHDLYLDTYDEAGIFAFLSIMVYIILSLRRFIRCIRNNQISFETRQIIACTYLIINIQFLLEPITEGMPWLLASYCFFDGVITHLLYKTNIKPGKSFNTGHLIALN